MQLLEAYRKQMMYLSERLLKDHHEIRADNLLTEPMLDARVRRLLTGT